MSRNQWRRYVPQWRNVRDNRSIRVVLYAVLGVILYLSMLGNVMPTQLNVEVFSVAKQDILSPDTVRNQKATKVKKAEAAASVEPVYTYNEKKKLVQIEKASAVFEAAKKVIEQSVTEQQKQANSQHQVADSGQQQKEASANGLNEKVINNRIQALQNQLSSDMLDALSADTLRTLVTADPEDLKTAKDLVSTTINRIMSEHITWDNLADAKQSVEEKLPSSGVSDELKQAIVTISKAVIVPNYTFNADLTKQKRQEAKEAVEPVVIQEGQIIVKKGKSSTEIRCTNCVWSVFWMVRYIRILLSA